MKKYKTNMENNGFLSSVSEQIYEIWDWLEFLFLRVCFVTEFIHVHGKKFRRKIVKKTVLVTIKGIIWKTVLIIYILESDW